MSARVVIPELLDHLPPDDPDALRSRQDLRRINFLMGNERWICRTMHRHSNQTHRGIIEIGAGDGRLCNRLARLFPNAPVTAFDLAPRPGNLDLRVIWHQGNIFETSAPNTGGVLVANLFLHHFEENELRALGRWMAHFDVLVFNEPNRSQMPHLLGNLMHPWINGVTRHDMHVSIDAGFSAGETGRLLDLRQDRWHVRETSTWRGSRRVVACRC